MSSSASSSVAGSFKASHPFEKRQEESSRIRQKYPDRVPVIAEKLPSSTIADIDKKKYLVPADLSMTQFLYVIRKRIKLESDAAIFMFVNGAMPPAGEVMSQIYKKHADADGFLYVTYSNENTFGESVESAESSSHSSGSLSSSTLE